MEWNGKDIRDTDNSGHHVHSFCGCQHCQIVSPALFSWKKNSVFLAHTNCVLRRGGYLPRFVYVCMCMYVCLCVRMCVLNRPRFT